MFGCQCHNVNVYEFWNAISQIILSNGMVAYV